MVEGGGGALGFGIEAANGLDLVAEEVNADGIVALGGVDVEDSAAEGDLARHFDDVDLRVADREEVLDEHVGHVLFAELEIESETTVEIAGEELHTGSFDGSDDEAGLIDGYLPERCSAGLLNFGVWGEIFEGEDVVGREAENGVGWDGTGEITGGEDGGVEGVGGLIVGDDDDAGGGCGSDEVRKVESAGGEGESRDTSAPRASA